MSAPNTVWQGANRRIHMQEVGLRDGLQMEKPPLCPPSRQDRAVQCAVGSGPFQDRGDFVHIAHRHSRAERCRGRDARDHAPPWHRVHRPGAQPVRGAERAIESRADELNLVMSASATHNIANLRMTQEHSFAALAQVVATGAGGANVAVNVSLSCVFGCPMEGEGGARGRCVRLGAALRRTWAWAAVTLCDTTGMAIPHAGGGQLTAVARARWPGVEFTLHFHNTRGMGLANVLAGISARVQTGSMHRWAGWAVAPMRPAPAAMCASEEIVHALALHGLRHLVGPGPCCWPPRSACPR